MLSATGNQLVDLLLGAENKTDWHAHYLAQAAEAEKTRESRTRARAAARRPGTKPSREPEAYVSTYEDPAYGTATIALKDGELRLTWSTWAATLKHYHYDTFELKGPGALGDELAVFVLKADGSVGSLRLLGQEFKRVER